MSRIGINGFGRVGRMTLRVALEDCAFVLAINDPNINIEYMAYLLRYDSTHGRFTGAISIDGEYLVINNQRIRVFNVKDPSKIDWRCVGAQYIVEASGLFTTVAAASAHTKGGAKKVIITTPSSDAPTLVCGVNHESYSPEMTVVSMSSCTTNCVAPLAKIINERFGIVECMFTTVHAATAEQRTVDGRSEGQWRDGRGAMQNIIPGTTAAAAAVGALIPELEGKITGTSLHVPLANASMVDMTVRLETPVPFLILRKTVEDVTLSPMRGIIGYTEDAVVSADIVGNPNSAVFDATASMALNDKCFKLIAWYDNEYAYAKRLIDLIRYMQKKD